MNKYEKAIREAVEEVLQKLGIESFRKTSWFPSSRKKNG